MAKLLKKPLKLALVQLAAGADKSSNLSHARNKVLEAASNGAKLVVLPECFNSPYGVKYFAKYAETLLPSPPSKEQSPSFHALSAMAKEAKAYLVGGSIPEYSPETKKYYNTNLTFGPDGALLATHRKVHLFDIDIPGKITFRESDVLSPGNKVTLVDLPEYGRIGIGICYDIRFPELAMIAARKGAFLLLYPGAFNLTTGQLHWELQARARAMDNQVYVGVCSPARDMEAEYHAWGHSMVVDPNAGVVAEVGEGEDVVYADLVNEKIEETRRGIPIYTQRRFDVYPDVSEGKIQPRIYQTTALVTAGPVHHSPKQPHHLRRPDFILAPPPTDAHLINMGMSSPSIAGQVPILSTTEGQRRSSNVHATQVSRSPSNASSVARGKDSGLNQRVLTTHVGREPAKIARKRLPWLDGGQQPKPGDVHIPGSFEPAEGSLDEAVTSARGPIVPVPDADAPVAPLQAPQTRGEGVLIDPLSNDPTLRAMGSTPSLQNRKRVGSKPRTLSMTSEPRPGIKPTPTKQHARLALGFVSEKSGQAEEYTPSEYSATISSDNEPGSYTSHESPPPKPVVAPAILPSTAVRRPLVVPKAPPRYSASRERGMMLPDTVVKRGTTTLKPQPPSKQPVNAPRSQTLHELPSHLMQSSSSTSPDTQSQSPTTSREASPLTLPFQPALPSANIPSTNEASPNGPLTRPDPVVVRSAGLRRENRSLSRAVAGLENLMEDALHVAKDAADSGRPDHVAHILDSAAAVLRKASTAIPKREKVRYGETGSPFNISPHESGDSDSFSSEHGVHSGFSSAMHSRDVSAGTAPTLLTRSAHSSAQPVLVDRYTGKNGKAPMSMRAPIKHGNASSADDDDSIAPTPPRLYQPASAESIVRDFAYVRMQDARAVSAVSLSSPPTRCGAAADFYSNNGESSPPLLRRSIALSKMAVDMPLPTDKDLPALPAPVVGPGKDNVGRVKRGAGTRPVQGALRELEHVPTDTEPQKRCRDSDSNPAGTVPQRRKKDRHHPHLSDFFETS
ncbi:Omega-amidase nit3 [Friedmanniomyces endolithicus]|nr:Omega-amidase nit3 [Friedmanniomyces endolithicus]